MPALPPLGGAFFVGPQARATGAEVAPVAATGGVQAASGDAVRAIEPGGEARGGQIDRRAEDDRRARTAFEELRRTLAGQDDPVALSEQGRRRAQETPAEVFERAFAPGDGEAPERAERTPRRFEDLFARPARRPPPSTGAEDPDALAFRRADPEPPIDGGEPDAVAEGAEAGAIDEAERAEAGEGAGEGDEARAADGTNRRGAGGDELTAEELEQVQRLEARDAEVRAHEQAHKSVGGRYAGAISYDFQTGPDGKRYAVGGEVSIDISEVPGDPRATIQKMEIVRRAALAPAQPSGADRSVAATASQKASQARVELTEQQAEEAAAAREAAAEAGEEAAEAGEGAESTEGAPPPPPEDAPPATPPADAPDAAPAAEETPAVDGRGLRRLEPGRGAGIFVDRPPTADRPEAPEPRASGPQVAALRAALG